MVTRTIVIKPNTSYVNVTGGEVIRFEVGDKSFLWNFNGPGSSFDLARVAHQPRQQPTQLTLVLQYQQLEGTLVTPLRTLHQLLIYFAVSHPRAVPESFRYYRRTEMVSAAPAGSIASAVRRLGTTWREPAS